MLDKMIRGSITRPRFLVTLLSCCIILIPPGGLVYGFSSISPYLLSYLHYLDPQCGTNKSAFGWIYSSLLLGQGLSMILGGLAEKRWPTRHLTIVAVFLFNASLALLTWTTANVVLLLFTYFSAGLSLGMIYVLSLDVGMSWIQDDYHGLAAGLICFGYGLSSVLVAPLQTLYINPNNVAPELNPTNGNYLFTDEALVGAVPHMFTVYAVLSFILQFPLALLIEKNTELRQTIDDRCIRVMIQRPEFYIMFAIFGLNKIPLAYVSSYAKFYGETFLEADMFLSIILGAAGVFNSVGRPFWGAIHDRLGAKWSLALLGGLTAMCILLSYLCGFITGSLNQKGAYSLSVWGAYFCCSGNYAIFPAATVHFFGQGGFGAKYGVLYLSQGLGAIASALCIAFIPLWLPLILAIVGTSLLSSVLSLLLNRKMNTVSELDQMGLLGAAEEFEMVEQFSRGTGARLLINAPSQRDL